MENKLETRTVLSFHGNFESHEHNFVHMLENFMFQFPGRVEGKRDRMLMYDFNLKKFGPEPFHSDKTANITLRKCGNLRGF